MSYEFKFNFTVEYSDNNQRSQLENISTTIPFSPEFLANSGVNRSNLISLLSPGATNHRTQTNVLDLISPRVAPQVTRHTPNPSSEMRSPASYNRRNATWSPTPSPRPPIARSRPSLARGRSPMSRVYPIPVRLAGQMREHDERESDGNDSGPSNSNVICAVCLIDKALIARNGCHMISTLCGHVFCSRCIDRVVQTQKACPTCRRQLTKDSYHQLFI